MHLPSLRTSLCTAALSLALFSAAAHGAATVTAVPSGDSAYTVQGTALDGVAGIQLDISYDAASLSTPTVTPGGLVAGAMLAANSSRPGLVKIAIISSRAFSGNGPIATIAFASRTGNGGITAITTAMIDSSGAPLPSSGNSGSTDTALQGTASTPALPVSQGGVTVSTGQTVQSGQSGGTTTAAVYPGSITLPAEQQRIEPPPAQLPVIPEPAVTADAPEPPRAPSRAAAEIPSGETQQYVLYKGVLDRFRQYRGSKTLPAMAALFDKKVAQSIRQEPALLLTDGRGKAVLTVDIPARITVQPVFEVTGGTLNSFTKDPQAKGRWIVELLPDAGAVRVSMTLIAGAEEFEYPLTVTPPLKSALTLDEPGWLKFLRETGTETAPLHDFNGDGVRDYIDEYIFVANFLAGKVK